jgi:hypothetical protein
MTVTGIQPGEPTIIASDTTTISAGIPSIAIIGSEPLAMYLTPAPLMVVEYNCYYSEIK